MTDKEAEDEQTAVVDTEAASEEPPVHESTVEESVEPTEEAAEAAESAAEPEPPAKRFATATLVAFAVLPVLALLLAIGAAWLKYYDNQATASAAARAESMQVAKESTATLLSYQPDTVEQQLNDAKNLLTGDFSGQYADLIRDVVIPNAKQQQVSAVATVSEAASVSAQPDRAVVLVFVNQTVVVGAEPPSDTASSVRVTLQKVDGHWLISNFDPV